MAPAQLSASDLTKSLSLPGPNIHQTLGLFLLTNALVILHGAVRVVFFPVQPGGAYGAATVGGFEQFPPGLLLFASAGEVFFGTFGLLISLAGIFGDFDVVKRTIRANVGVSIFFGWAAFLVFAMGNEIYTITRADTQVFPRVMGFLAIIAYCASLIGSQAFFGIQLMHTLNGNGAMYNLDYFRKRHIYYNTLLLIVGLTCFAVGVYAVAETGVAGLAVSDNDVLAAFGGGVTGGNAEAAPAGGNPEGAAAGGNPEGAVVPAAAAGGNPEGAAAGGNPEGAAVGGNPEGAAAGGNPEGAAGAAVFANFVNHPPFANVVPALNIITGFVMVLLAVWGYARASSSALDRRQTFADGKAPVWEHGRIDAYGMASAAVFVLHLAYVGFAAPAYTRNLAAGVQIPILAITLQFMPVYLEAKMRAIGAVVAAAEEQDAKMVETGAVAKV